MRKLIALSAALCLTGCGAINAYTSAGLSAADADYAGAKSNAQKIDDDKFQVWQDTACLLNLGALQRSKSQTAVGAALKACPVSNPANTLTAAPAGGIQAPATP